MSNLKKIITLYGVEAIATHLGVSKSSVEKYNARGYLKNIKQINKLAEKDSNFSVNDFVQDYKVSE
jgi:hypothetical protein